MANYSENAMTSFRLSEKIYTFVPTLMKDILIHSLRLSDFERLKQEIDSLKTIGVEGMAQCRNRIREIENEIRALPEGKDKKTLLRLLEENAHLGLCPEINNLFYLTHSQQTTYQLHLIREHKTELPDLFQSETVDQDIAPFDKRIRKDHEVFGALVVKEIDTSQQWVKRLCEKAPSFKALLRLPLPEFEACCKGAKEEELDILHDLVEDKKLFPESPDSNIKTPHLPVSVTEALKGVNHSEHTRPYPAKKPLFVLIEPVELCNRHLESKEEYIEFSDHVSCTTYLDTLAECKVRMKIDGTFLPGVGAMVNVRGTEDRRSESSHGNETITKGASIMKYWQTSTKSFRIKPSQRLLSIRARQKAKSIMDEGNDDLRQNEEALSFIQTYGSHFPGGDQILGGILVYRTNITSTQAKTFSSLIKQYRHHLGINGSAGNPHIKIEGGVEVKKANQRRNYTEQVDEGLTYHDTKKAIGPQTTDPEEFKEALKQETHWELIDRGRSEEYIPVWELIKARPEDGLQEAAAILEKKWRETEKKKENEEKRTRQESLTKRELAKLEKEQKDEETGWKRCGIEGDNILSQEDPSFSNLEEAYKTATEFIMKNPELHICEIKKRNGRFPWQSPFELRGIKTSGQTELSLKKTKNPRALFYSKNRFSGKDQLS